MFNHIHRNYSTQSPPPRCLSVGKVPTADATILAANMTAATGVSMTVMLTISMAVVVWLMAMIVVVVMAAVAAIVVTVTVGSGRVR